jgi:iron complex outermembrane receptor protein
MNAKHPVTVLAAWLVLLFAPTHSIQSAESGLAPAGRETTGVIAGRVQNEVTGRYLNNARVTVKEANLRVFTDESGNYRITNVPAGTITLEILYSGLDEKQISVSVAPGQTLIQKVNLAPAGSEIVRIDPFMVESTRSMDQSTIAINEQRFAPNIKTVVSTGDLSEHTGGSIAEFLKFVPGIAIDDARPGGSSVSVRGFPSDQTVVTQDGAAASNASTSPDVRNLGTRMTMGLTNVARVEVSKVPTPSTGADTMAGSVNLISRNAFESAKPEFRYTLTLSGEHTHIFDALSLRKKYSYWGDENHCCPVIEGCV